MTITNKDVDKLKEVFATKEDLNRFATKEDLDRKFDKVLSGQDRIMKELEKARGDRVLAKGKDDEQDRRLDGLEGRVQKIEVKVG